MFTFIWYLKISVLMLSTEAWATNSFPRAIVYFICATTRLKPMKVLEKPCLHVQFVIRGELYLVSVQLLAWTNKPTMCCIMYVNTLFINTVIRHLGAGCKSIIAFPCLSIRKELHLGGKYIFRSRGVHECIVQGGFQSVCTSNYIQTFGRRKWHKSVYTVPEIPGVVL